MTIRLKNRKFSQEIKRTSINTYLLIYGIKNNIKNVFNILVNICFSLFIIIASYSAEPAVEIRKINPPKLTEHHLGKRILCHRPMRKGSPAMFIQKTQNKIIAHNYGHGGSGWTLGPGATQYVINLLEQAFKVRGIQKNEPIAIIGAGVIGYMSALELVNRGFTDITIYAASFDNLASHNAGALLAPVSMDNNPQMQKLINKIGVDAYKFYKGIADGKNSQFTQSGVKIIPAYFENRQDSGLEPYVGIVMNPAKDVILDFQNGTTRKMVAYDDGIFINTHVLMGDLYNILKDKIKFVKTQISEFHLLKQLVVLNCTGIGSKDLVRDEKMVSVQGHLIMLKNQNPSDINHMILVYFDKGKTKSNYTIKRSFYMFPKRLPGYPDNDIGVIGGTFIEGADEKTPHEEEYEIMLESTKKFYGIK